MPGREHVVHVKHCVLLSSEDTIQISFKNKEYILRFSSAAFQPGRGVVVDSLPIGSHDTDLLLWLSVYFGEDFIEPFPQIDTRNSSNRGDLHVDSEALRGFLRAAERMPPKRQKWKAQLIENAIQYFSVALRSGVAYMPLTVGFFGMTAECIGNTRQKAPLKYYTLGDNRVNNLINDRLARGKKSSRLKERTKSFAKEMNGDFELVHLLRNTYYGHSLTHQKDERAKLLKALRSTYIRAGASPQLAHLTYLDSRLDDSIQLTASFIYKVGLRYARSLLFMLLGISRSIPIATYDYKLFGPPRYGEPRQYRGITIVPFAPVIAEDN
jgi:hypothetical protein